MTQRTAPWENWHLERGVELLRIFGLVRWGLGGSGHVKGTGEKLSFAFQAPDSTGTRDSLTSMSWLLYQLVYNPACLVAPGILLLLCKKKSNPNKEKTQNASTKTPIPPYPTHDQAIDSLNTCPDKEPVLPRPDVNEIAANSRFLILSLTNTDVSKKSPFAIHKALIGIGGEPKSVKRLRSDSPITISPHKTLNSCRGVISESDLLTTPVAEILDGFSDQGVIQVPEVRTFTNFLPWTTDALDVRLLDTLLQTVL
ncbi:uncharacterized protein TNCV_3153941 [Trichonephila clavipes]|nr:uncharacterized protein TNCV_3153941 [Trichonephila clavipes]